MTAGGSGRPGRRKGIRHAESNGSIYGGGGGSRGGGGARSPRCSLSPMQSEPGKGRGAGRGVSDCRPLCRSSGARGGCLRHSPGACRRPVLGPGSLLPGAGPAGMPAAPVRPGPRVRCSDPGTLLFPRASLWKILGHRSSSSHFHARQAPSLSYGPAGPSCLPGATPTPTPPGGLSPWPPALRRKPHACLCPARCLTAA